MADLIFQILSKRSTMLPPGRKRDPPKRLDPHPTGSKHDLISTRVKKNAEKKKQRDMKRKQRDKGNVHKEVVEEADELVMEVDKDKAPEDPTMETGKEIDGKKDKS